MSGYRPNLHQRIIDCATTASADNRVVAASLVDELAASLSTAAKSARELAEALAAGAPQASSGWALQLAADFRDADFWSREFNSAIDIRGAAHFEAIRADLHAAGLASLAAFDAAIARGEK